MTRLMDRMEPESAPNLAPDGESFEALGAQMLHDLQLGTQTLLNAVENLEEDVMTASLAPAILRRVESVKLRTLELSTTLQSLQGGEYLGEYDYSALSLGLLVSATVKTFEEQALSHHVTIDATRVRDLKILASKRHVKVLLNNLVHNAIKYSYEGTEECPRIIKMSASLHGIFARLRIENYGVGIHPEETPRLFTPGFRGAMARAAGRTGSGMGLFTARNIAERMGGRLRLLSHPTGDGRNHPHLTEAIVDLACGRGE